jgi:hypothetical protein
VCSRTSNSSSNSSIHISVHGEHTGVSKRLLTLLLCMQAAHRMSVALHVRLTVALSCRSHVSGAAFAANHSATLPASSSSVRSP